MAAKINPLSDFIFNLRISAINYGTSEILKNSNIDRNAFSQILNPKNNLTVINLLKIVEGMKGSLVINLPEENLSVHDSKKKVSLADTHPFLLKYWDFEKNSSSPEYITYKSEVRVHWKCPKGHKFKGIIQWQINSLKCKKCKLEYETQYLK